MPSKRQSLLLVSLLLLGVDMRVDAATNTKSKQKAKPAATAAAESPCNDYYGMVNADWLKANPAPAAGSVSAFDAMLANARQQERTLLEADASAPGDDTDRALGALWSDGMNEIAIEAAGATPLRPLFDRIAQAKKAKDLPAVIADLHAAGVPVLFNFSSDVDLKDFDHQLGYAIQGGLGLPDPDYYTRADADSRALFGRYRAYVEKILLLSGTPAAQVSTESGWVLGIEVQLAQASLPLVQLRDPSNEYRPVTLVELQKAYPNLAFGSFLRTQHADDDRISLAHTGYFTAADGMLVSVPVEQWQAYLRFHVANSLAPYLSSGFQDAHFQMYDRVLDGKQQPQPRWLAVLNAVDLALGEPLGHAYAERYLPQASKAAATSIADGLRDAAKNAIANNAWMDPSTRAAAQAKLEKLRVEIGEPTRKLPLSGLTLGGSGYAADMLAAAAWRHQRDMAAIGKRTAERRWPVLAQIPDVSYDLVQNRIVVTAAFLQPPVFDASADIAQQYGALGALIGHQLHYAFDDKGRTIDADGQLHDWWTPLASAAYEQRTAPIIAQYDAYEVNGGVKVNGHQTRDENLADLGGVELALDALKATLPSTAQAPHAKGAQKPSTAQPPASDAKASERHFFEAFAKVWERSSAPDTATAEVSSSIQAPAKARVNGTLANLPEFGTAYACKAGQSMDIKTPVSIWR
ncbi:MAG TPA: M13 family metallopeptidase [Xanthomonadaceae bacterium]|jgi:putative endopeptidase|nr:M13 family metallopeptidase [Xanthomonadaceae bacterium]